MAQRAQDQARLDAGGGDRPLDGGGHDLDHLDRGEAAVGVQVRRNRTSA